MLRVGQESDEWAKSTDIVTIEWVLGVQGVGQKSGQHDPEYCGEF